MITTATGSSQMERLAELFVRALRTELAALHAAAAQQPEWEAMAQLDAQRGQLVHTLRTGLQSPRTWRAGADLLIATLPFAQRYGYWETWRELAQLAREAAPPHAPDRPFYRTRLQIMSGHLLTHQNQWDAAEAALLAAQREAAAQAHPELRLRAASELAWLYERLGRLEEAIAQGREATALATAHPNLPPVLQSDTRRRLGCSLRVKGDGDRAIPLLQQALAIAQQHDLFLPRVRSLADLGMALCDQNEYTAGIDHLRAAVRLLAPTQFLLDRAHNQYLLGVMLMRHEQLEAAADAFAQIERPLLRQRNMAALLALLLNALGNLFLKQGKLSAAETDLQEAALYGGISEDEYLLAFIEETLSNVLEEQGRLPEAAAQLAQAMPRLAQFAQDAHAQQLLAKSRDRYQALTGRAWEG